MGTSTFSHTPLQNIFRKYRQKIAQAENVPLPWFSPQSLTMARFGPAQIQEPRTDSKSLTLLVSTEVLETSPDVCLLGCKLAGIWNGESSWDSNLRPLIWTIRVSSLIHFPKCHLKTSPLIIPVKRWHWIAHTFTSIWKLVQVSFPNCGSP